MIIYGRNAKTISSYALVFAQLFLLQKMAKLKKLYTNLSPV